VQYSGDADQITGGFWLLPYKQLTLPIADGAKIINLIKTQFFKGTPGNRRTPS